MRTRSALIAAGVTLALVAGGATAGASYAATPAAAVADTTPAIVAATNAFLATLTTAQKTSVQFAWTNTTQKKRWSNLPQGLYTRAGLMWGNLTTAQQNAWLAVMQVTLSPEGYTRVRQEWAADDQLASGGGLQYGQQYYWIALIGTPSATTPWQWQWGGHHVTVNATVSGSSVALYPSFIGAQPASYTSSGATVKPLGDIWTSAYALLSSLTTAQKSAAVLGSTYIDLLYGPGQDSRAPAFEGIPGSSLTAAQKTALLTLISKYGNLANAEDAASRLTEISATLDQTYFAWYGPTTNAGNAYFRVTGPRVIIEYSPQAMGGTAANHIHGIYRDPQNDYGAAITG
ncbi:DUF3500 domain-containing protein [Paractinoplanes durhamensis]|uniref:DUF3500 domain-containing protein n=1 Tax=Paractinoplanes durhamensis TaxID=113563 RepID=A0ABQ3YS00_9ACTN|nr:DUF3500 domain-containing protein [Actinoplanes durhamensis]GIE00364.1 hypothetical protein Adu01nite_17140 [Actinoplanes durhamensis]